MVVFTRAKERPQAKLTKRQSSACRYAVDNNVSSGCEV